MVQFNWKGTWLPNLPYNENVVVEYQNVNYISLSFVEPTDVSPYYDPLHWDEMVVIFNTPTPTPSITLSPTVTPTQTLAPQVANPDGDISNNGWVGTPDTLQLWNNIDDFSIGENSYDYSTGGGSVVTLEVSLKNFTYPNTNTGWYISYAIIKSSLTGVTGSTGGGNATLTLGLYEGGNLIASTAHTVSNVTWANYDFYLLDTQVANIVNVNDLRLRFVATNSGTKGVAVAYAYLQLPLSVTPTPTPSNTQTPTNTLTPTLSPTLTPTLTPSITPTNTLTPTLSPTLTPSITPTSSVTPTVTSSVTPSLTPTSSVSVTPSLTPSVTSSITGSSRKLGDSQNSRVHGIANSICLNFLSS